MEWNETYAFRAAARQVGDVLPYYLWIRPFLNRWYVNGLGEGIACSLFCYFPFFRFVLLLLPNTKTNPAKGLISGHRNARVHAVPFILFYFWVPQKTSLIQVANGLWSSFRWRAVQLKVLFKWWNISNEVPLWPGSTSTQWLLRLWAVATPESLREKKQMKSKAGVKSKGSVFCGWGNG